MEPSAFTQKNKMLLLGLSLFGNPFALKNDWTEENEICGLWKRFMNMLSTSQRLRRYFSCETSFYEICVLRDEAASKGLFETFIGIEINDINLAPYDMLVKTLPSSDYAIFTLEGKRIETDWRREIYREWLPGSGYQEAFGFSLQLYDYRFKGFQNIEDSIIDVYIPVKPM